MRIGRIVRKLACVGLTLFFVSVTPFPDAGHAQLQRFKPEVVLPKHYPDGFDGCGHIEFISTTGMIVADRFYNFAPGAEFHTPQKGNVSPYLFKKGALIGFMKDAIDQIVSVWLIE
jgi:hypothetical protein